MIASSTDSIYRGLKGIFNPMLNSWSIDNLSIEIYENQYFRSNFTQIYVYLFRLSFLITLNIYKDYFKGCQSLRKYKAKFCSCKLWQETKFALVHLSLEEVVVYPVGFCDQGVLWSSLCDELKNFAANIILKLVVSHVLGSVHWLVSHVLGAVHWKREIVTTKQVQLGIVVRIQL